MANINVADDGFEPVVLELLLGLPEVPEVPEVLGVLGVAALLGAEVGEGPDA